MSGGVREIPLTKGKTALVDEADYERLSQCSWFLKADRYAARSRKKSDGPGGKTIYMHREVIDIPDGYEADHINRNSIDNRRSNLRLCTRSQNMQNRWQSNATGFLGVASRPGGLFCARIKTPTRRIEVSGFCSAVDAARARDALARKHHGEFAVLNFPDEAPTCEAAREFRKQRAARRDVQVQSDRVNHVAQLPSGEGR